MRPSGLRLALALVFGAVVGLGALLGTPERAEAFCGFYVGGAGQELFNDATMTVLMRDGKRTVLSMQNTYQGPPKDFAMVVPVPVVLQKDNVKTLSPEVFDKIDKMAAPRLVEYWERDPCAPPIEYERERRDATILAQIGGRGRKSGSGRSVQIEAQFEVGEYEIVILSATESTALDRWLRQNKYNIPKGADKVLGPYIEQGMYFFVAKVNSKKVKFNGNQATLSPLRFYYDSDTFSLPVRLGLLNAKGAQDLIVHILARGQRYEVANYKNVTIPTNIAVAEDAKPRFGQFYAALFDQTLKQNPGAVVTEYAWAANTCDPCPGPNLNGRDFLTFGADVLPGQPQSGFVLTRLHARYTKDQLKEDLVFKAAPPIVGGRQQYFDGELEQKSRQAGVNNFQGRYIIYHPWKGKVACKNPQWGNWGGPPNGQSPRPKAAQDLASAPRGGVVLNGLVRQDIPEIKVRAKRKIKLRKPKLR